MAKKKKSTSQEENKTKNTRTDKYAKAKFKEYLEDKGYNDIHQINFPTDFEACKNGVHYYFELKMTSKMDGVYFGAASITEWGACLDNPESELRFVIAQSKDGTNDENTKFEFKPITIENLIPYSTIPPFKINFNYPLSKKETDEVKKKKSGKEKTAHFSKELIEPLTLLHKALRNEKIGDISKLLKNLENEN